MAADIRQQPYATIVSAITTGLNSLANNSRAISSAQGADAPSAGSEPLVLADFELVVTFGTAPTAGTAVDLYIIRSVDGTNYTDGGTSTTPPSTSYVGSFPVAAVTTAQRISLNDVPLPPGLWEVLIHNNGTGQAFAASANTLKYRAHGFRSV